MNKRTRALADQYYLYLAGIFIASLVACNLIFQKFFIWGPLPSWNPFGFEFFEQSVGLLPYPITFLVTDLISEIYGRKKADRVVMAGLLSSVFVLGIVFIAERAQATSWSPVSDETFTLVFGNMGIAVGASMMAYLFAQFIDIRVFHFWKNLTKGKHLWLRNNASTFTSQFADTVVVLVLLCSYGVIEWKLFSSLLLQGFLFKWLVAILDTPLLYFFTWLLRKQLGLKMGQEVTS